MSRQCGRILVVKPRTHGPCKKTPALFPVKITEQKEKESPSPVFTDKGQFIRVAFRVRPTLPPGLLPM